MIIMSGDAEVRDTIAAMHLSVVDFLLKPIDTDQVAQTDQARVCALD
jgi:two-component system, OmpR family, response regulator